MVSAVGGDVAAWSASDGRQVWENRFDSGPVVDLELAESGQEQVATDAIVLSGEKDGVVRRLDGTNGNVRWEFRDDRYEDCLLDQIYSLREILTRGAVVMSRFRFPPLPQIFTTSHYSRLFWEGIKLRSRR